MNIECSIDLAVTGLGIILYSPHAVQHIPDRTDYLSTSYMTPEQVVPHILTGSIVGFCTGSPGSYTLKLLRGYPDPKLMDSYRHVIRLGIEVRGGNVCFRDLYDLMEWSASCPSEQTVALDDGFYHLTVCTNLPESGIAGDNQRISIWFNNLNSMPLLRYNGIPMLC